MYHSVLDQPQEQFLTLGRIMHSAEVFRQQMEAVARHYVPVSMDDVLQFARGEKRLPQRSVAVTFDDGYLDNYEVALPILSQLGIPGTFYLTVDCVENAKLPWPSRLRFAFFTTPQRIWTDHQGRVFPLDNQTQRDRAFLRACDFCATLAGSVQEQYVVSVESEFDVDPSNCQKIMMNWEHARALAAKGHIVGSHTMTHPNMAHVSDADAELELAGSKRKMEEELGFPVIHFSYPCPALFPHWKESTVQLSRRAGYQSAVTTNGGPVLCGDDPLRLRRARPTPDVHGLRWNLECGFLGRPV